MANFGGMDLTNPINRIRAGMAAVCANVRAYLKGGFALRNPLTAALYTLAAAVHTIRRLNDSTPNGPASGYSIINGAGTVVSLWNTTAGVVNVAAGVSGNPMSFVPFRPNTSPQPWMYIGDSAPAGNVTLATQYLISGTPVSFVSSGMMKVRSDGLVYKMGIKEPQLAPLVSTANSSVTKTGTLKATAIPWTNYSGANSAYNYGETNGYPKPSPDGTAPYIVDCANASFITINSITGSATINGGTKTPTSSGPVTSTYPAYYIMAAGTGVTPPSSATVITGCFTDGAGNVIAAGAAPLYVPSVVDVGAAIGVSNGIQVPSGAQVFQIGIDSSGNTFSSNSGSFAISVTVTTNALPTVTSILGSLTAYYWGDSPTSGPVGAYIWKNPDDSGGGGPTRSISDAVGSTTGNSFIFDCSFGSAASPPLAAGIPGLPGVGTDALAMQWTVLSPESVAIGSNAVFAAPITVPSYNVNNTEFANFNFCLTGQIYFPASGNYTLVLTSHQSCMWGIGGGVTLVSATATGSGEGSGVSLSDYGQTITVVGKYPLLPRQVYANGTSGTYSRVSAVVNAPAAGIYPIEIDYDYWYDKPSTPGRILLLMASPTPTATPTIIPPLPIGVREETQYRYVYRSDATGAQSNPSPESAVESVPVTSNTITSAWSPDPQVNWVDYYRIDSATSDFTYVNTGPNDGLGGTVAGVTFNTSVTDSLSDTELGTQLLDYSNFEPFPNTDLPQRGTCSVSGGVITWLSGGAVGGTQQGFNMAWLAGTTILIGSPTSLAYVMIARPTPAAFQNSYLYPMGFVILDPAYHYQQVTVSGTSQSTGTPSWNDAGGTTTSGGATFQDQGLIFNGNGYATQITIPGVPDGTSLAYQIPEPALAAVPVAYLWGPSDNIPFTLGCTGSDGTLRWCAGNNLDSAPDTNQQDLTDPSEALVNGILTGGKSIVFTIKRAIAVVPNFFNALATAQGTTGSTWSVKTTSINRGLFIPRCLCVSGGGLLYFRVDDGIHVSPSGLESKSITDETLYPLFAHEGSAPVAISRNGITVYPPDDSLPNKQKFTYQNGYMYWDYQGTDGNPHTLVFDEAAMGWILDSTTPAATVHAANEGESTQGIIVGCADFSVRQMASTRTETVTGTVLTPAIGSEGFAHIFEITVEYSSHATVTLSFIAADSGNGSYGPNSITLPSTGGTPTKYDTKVSANKFKWLQMQFQSTDHDLQVYLEGCIADMKPWGSSEPFQAVQMFGESGGGGAEK